MRNLFVSYHGILRYQGMSWLTDSNPKVVTHYILTAVGPKSLRMGLKSGLSFARNHLKAEFRAFMKQTTHLVEAFQMVDLGPRQRNLEVPERVGKGTKTHKIAVTRGY